MIKRNSLNVLSSVSNEVLLYFLLSVLSNKTKVVQKILFRKKEKKKKYWKCPTTQNKILLVTSDISQRKKVLLAYLERKDIKFVKLAFFQVNYLS